MTGPGLPASRSVRQELAAIREMVDAADEAIAELEATLSEAGDLRFDRLSPIARARQQHAYALAALTRLHGRTPDVYAS